MIWCCSALREVYRGLVYWPPYDMGLMEGPAELFCMCTSAVIDTPYCATPPRVLLHPYWAYFHCYLQLSLPPKVA